MPKLSNICKKWGNKSIFDQFSLDITPNKTTVILGKSGVGKSTLLSIIANLTDFSGTVSDFEEISFVFQEPRLIPFLTVKENLSYALYDALGENFDAQIDKYLQITGLFDMKNKLADTLSGGEKQRVSLIRAFAYPSKTILLDEPFSSLDLGIKLKIIDLYNDLLGLSTKTAVLVTHNIDEAIYLADEIVFLEDNSYKRFYIDTLKHERKFGYEDDSSLRIELYSLFSADNQK